MARAIATATPPPTRARSRICGRPSASGRRLWMLAARQRTGTSGRTPRTSRCRDRRFRHQAGKSRCAGARSQPAAAARSAASTTLLSSIARVIGPTPPGFGDTNPATLPHVVGHVAGHPALAGLLVDDARHPDVEHGRARLDHVGRDDARHPGRRDDDVGLAHLGREVAGTGVAQRHRRVLRTPREDEPERPAHRQPAPDDDDLGAGDRHVVAAQQLDAAHRRARQRRRLARARASRGSSGAGRRRPWRGRRRRGWRSRRGRSAAGR